MSRELSLFIGTFTTLLAIINPFEVLPVYLKLLEGKDVETHRRVAWKSCVYALFLSLFFLIFGTLLLRLFGVPLAFYQDRVTILIAVLRIAAIGGLHSDCRPSLSGNSGNA
jgi:small neutral amino acid transporter SnatA (MarC family)